MKISLYGNSGVSPKPSFIELLMKMQGLLNEVDLDSLMSARLLIVDNDAFLRTTLRHNWRVRDSTKFLKPLTLLEVFKNCQRPNLI